MIRIVFVITGLSTGGAETMLLKVLERIDRTCFDPYVISLTDEGEIGPRIRMLGVSVEALDMRGGLAVICKMLLLVRRLRGLRAQVLHTWMYHADLLGGLAGKVAGIPAVGWALRNSSLDPSGSKWTTRAVMHSCAVLSYLVPRRILSCSERARDVHVAAGYCARKIVVIPNGFDLDRFRPDADAAISIRRELGIDATVLLVGLVARYDAQKNHKGFIEAAKHVHAAMPQVNFVMAGAGVTSGNADLIAAIDSSGLRKSFHLLGRRNDIPRLMAGLDVLCSSSSYGEAFPNVLGEAMACGVPCVVTDAGDSADILADTGRVVRVGDMTGLARELVSLLSMPVEQRRLLGHSARQRVQERYEISRVVKQYEAFYMSLLDRKKECAV